MKTRKMTLEKFHKDYDGDHNLYIVWCNHHALYVGISRVGIWNRWFASGSQHMFIDGDRWIGLSLIGHAISRNQPESLQWIIELRDYVTDNLLWIERDLIIELKPLYNSHHSQGLTDEKFDLKMRLDGFYIPGSPQEAPGRAPGP